MKIILNFSYSLLFYLSLATPTTLREKGLSYIPEAVLPLSGLDFKPCNTLQRPQHLKNDYI